MELNEFSDKIICWYHQNKRDFPWRNTHDPYLIWLSEVILQQTRVKQGLPYYQKFVEKYPTVDLLASADEQEVLRLWQGLGYYSRARNMHAAAKYICEHLDGNFPDSYEKLIKLKGVGHYTAAAIASFAYHEDKAVLDGNVFRVLSRFFGIETDIASTQGLKDFSELAYKILPKGKAATYNQAVMEFGAIQCTPSKPECEKCPLNEHCIAYLQGRQSSLPVKIKKLKIKSRYFHYLIFIHKDRLAMKLRHNNDIWGGLYDFYLIENHSLLNNFDEIIKNHLHPDLDKHIILEKESAIYKHILTHQRIFVRFWHIDIKTSKLSDYLDFKDLEFYSIKTIKELPKPILIHNYLEKFFF